MTNVFALEDAVILSVLREGSRVRRRRCFGSEILREYAQDDDSSEHDAWIRRRISSYIITPAATPTLRESARPVIGSCTLTLQSFRSESDKPCRSSPSKIASGTSRGRSVQNFGAPGVSATP